jgi:uncharacterized protein
MHFIIHAIDHPDSLTARLAHRADHRKRIEALHKAGQLVTAGPLPNEAESDPQVSGFSGSLIIADFPNEASARAWADTDPYVLNGVYAEIRIYPYLQTFSASPSAPEANN